MSRRRERPRRADWTCQECGEPVERPARPGGVSPRCPECDADVADPLSRVEDLIDLADRCGGD